MINKRLIIRWSNKVYILTFYNKNIHVSWPLDAGLVRFTWETVVHGYTRSYETTRHALTHVFTKFFYGLHHNWIQWAHLPYTCFPYSFLWVIVFGFKIPKTNQFLPFYTNLKKSNLQFWSPRITKNNENGHWTSKTTLKIPEIPVLLWI